jgi:hypothetical protein
VRPLIRPSIKLFLRVNTIMDNTDQRELEINVLGHRESNQPAAYIASWLHTNQLALFTFGRKHSLSLVVNSMQSITLPLEHNSP